MIKRPCDESVYQIPTKVPNFMKGGEGEPSGQVLYYSSSNSASGLTLLTPDRSLSKGGPINMEQKTHRWG